MNTHDKMLLLVLVGVALVLMRIGWVPTPMILEPTVDRINLFGNGNQTNNTILIPQTTTVEKTNNVQKTGEVTYWTTKNILFVFAVLAGLYYINKKKSDWFFPELDENAVEMKVEEFSKFKKGIPYGYTFGFSELIKGVWVGWYKSTSTFKQTLGRYHIGTTFKVRYHNQGGVKEFRMKKFDPDESGVTIEEKVDEEKIIKKMEKKFKDEQKEKEKEDK